MLIKKVIVFKFDLKLTNYLSMYQKQSTLFSHCRLQRLNIFAIFERNNFIIKRYQTMKLLVVLQDENLHCKTHINCTEKSLKIS